MPRQPELRRVLLVDDDEDDYLITREMLAKQERVSFSLDWCSSYHEALAAIREQRHDIYLVDYNLGRHTGLELVQEAFASRPRAPVIMLTGAGHYGIDVEANALGVTDYLVKQDIEPAGLERSIRYAISHHEALTDLANSEERYALAARAANDGIWDWDLTTDRIYLSPRWHEILGEPGTGGTQDPVSWFERVRADDLMRLRAAIDAHLDGQTPHLEVEQRMRHADGSWRWILARGLAMRDPKGVPTRIAGSISDITDSRVAQLQLEHDALHDPLTGLPNRALFMDRLEHVLERWVRDPTAGCAVLFVDVDRFKVINDSLSHAVGDQLLAALAERIEGALRPGDTVARLGGDEFTLLLEGVDADRDAMIVAERIQRAMAGTFEIGGNELVVTASIGIAISSPRISAADLLRNADIAMYEAKREGDGQCAVFDDGMRDRVVNRVTHEGELREAVEQSLIPVHYQPIVDLATGQVRGLEAFARWPRGRSELPPAEFIPIAEEIGMIGALGMHVLSTALRTLRTWRHTGLVGADVCVSVNISARQLDDPALPGQILEAIGAADLPASALWLEIAEGTLMQEPERLEDAMSQLVEHGVGLHLDDFGTAYSSLAVLHRLPFDSLKMDRSFVSAITGDGCSDKIVQSTVALAHALGLRVIAEGVETEIELQRLRGLGCEYGQGYLFSAPLAADQLSERLGGWSASAAVAVGDRAAPT